MTKKELRRTMKARNLSLGAEARSVASARIFGRVGELPAFAAAHTVALFSALPDEPDTGGVAERWRAAGKRLVLPRVEGDAMRFCDCDPAALRRGAFGIAEPEPGARTCPPGEIDLVVVPGVAFTAGGVRLGRGKGYYDRYLSQAEFRHNVITHHCEIRWTEEAGFLPLTDRDVNTLWGRMNKTVGRVYLTDIYNVIHSEFVPLFNPFQSYFDHLPSWDGVSDPIGDLADTVHVKSDQAEFRDYFRKWFVGILPALLDDTVVNHEILVLIGEQGLYKTTWFNFLLPPELRCYFYTKTNSDRLNKDDLFSLTEFALICFEELDGMRPAELNQLKAMVTMPYVNERAAYGRNKDRHPHIASFCVTGNNVQFLTDPTGNRRWLPFEVSQIRDPHLHAIPYELVYSQAYALWKSGFCHWFSQEEIRKLNMHNSRFEVPNLEEDLIRTHFRKPFEGEAGIFVTAADILEQISSCLRYPLSPNKIGRIMAGLEFESIRYKGKRGYITVKKTGEDIDRERRSGALGL